MAEQCALAQASRAGGSKPEDGSKDGDREPAGVGDATSPSEHGQVDYSQNHGDGDGDNSGLNGAVGRALGWQAHQCPSQWHGEGDCGVGGVADVPHEEKTGKWRSA